MNTLRAFALLAVAAVLLGPFFAGSAKAEPELDAYGSIGFVTSYSPNPVPPGGTTTVNYQIKNSSIFPMVEMAFTDALTDRFAVDADSVKSSCGGAVLFPNHYTIKLANGVLGPGGSCLISVQISVPSFMASLYTTDLQLTAKGLAPITAPPTVLRVEKLDQTIDFGPIPEDRMVAKSVVKITAAASSGLPVSFAAKGACVLSGENTLTLLYGDAVCAVTATQPGDAQYNAAEPAKYSFTVAMASQTIDFPPIPDATFDALFVIPKASASSDLEIEYATSGPCLPVFNDKAIGFLGVGECTVTARQTGSSAYTAALEVKRSFTILKANQTISFAKLPDRTVGDGPFNVMAESSLKLPSLNLPISFSAKGECSVKGNTVTLSGKPGECTITAKQPGNEVINAAKSVSRTFAISSPAMQSQAITFAGLLDRTAGDAPFQLSAIASSGLPVSFSAEGECSVQGATVSLSGKPGECTITASQQGDATYNPASAVTRSFTIAPAAGPSPTPSPEPAPAPHTVYLPLLSR